MNMTIAEMIQTYHGFAPRIALAKERLARAVALVNEVDLAAAVKVAAQDMGLELPMSQIIPPLFQAFILDSLRDSLLAALQAEILDPVEALFADFKTQNQALLVSHGVLPIT